MLSKKLKSQITAEGKQRAAKNSNKLLAHTAKTEYELGAVRYAQKWEAAEKRAERAEKALMEIGEYIINCHDRLIDPSGFTILPKIDEALTPKTSEDE